MKVGVLLLEGCNRSLILRDLFNDLIILAEGALKAHKASFHQDPLSKVL